MTWDPPAGTQILSAGEDLQDPPADVLWTFSSLQQCWCTGALLSSELPPSTWSPCRLRRREGFGIMLFRKLEVSSLDHLSGGDT